MIIVFLAVLAASFSYLVNTLIIDKLGLSVLVDIIPFIEEFFKDVFSGNR